jgi:hypothetical protein
MKTSTRIRYSAKAGDVNTWEQGIVKLEIMHEMLQAKRNAQTTTGLAGVKKNMDLQLQNFTDEEHQEAINKEIQQSLLKTNTNVDTLSTGVTTLTSEVGTCVHQQTRHEEVLDDLLVWLENLVRVRCCCGWKTSKGCVVAGPHTQIIFYEIGEKMLSIVIHFLVVDPGHWGSSCQVIGHSVPKDSL